MTMRLTHWVFLIIFVVTVGCLQVAAHNSVIFKSYAVGEKLIISHKKNTDVRWLDVRVMKLTSPVNLAIVARNQKMKPIIRLASPSPKRPVRFAARVHASIGE